MPGFVPIAQTTTVHLRFTIDGADCENTFHYKWSNTTPPTASELASLVNEVESTLAVKYRAMTAAGWQYRETYAINRHAQPAAQAVISSSLAGAPRGGDTLPGNVSDWITRRTGLSGRSQHGGFNLSGFSEGDVTGKTLQTALINLIINFLLSVLAARVGGRFIPAVASKKNNNSTVLTGAVSKTTRTNSAKTRLTT